MRARLHGVHPILDSPGPVGIAHRGGAGEAPENTLEAFGAAVALGYRYLETDAHVSRDGVVVAFHDPRLDDRTDRTGAIAALSIAEIEAADAGHVFSPDAGRSFLFRGRGVRIPRLEELLLRWPEARVNIDPKADACVEPLVAVIERLRAWDRVGIGAFSDRRLRRVRALSRGRACTSMGPRAVAGARAAALCGRMPRQGADCVQVPLRAGRVPIVTAGFVRAAHRAGLPVHVWTVNAESSMHDLLDLGVDGIVTDRPRLLRDVFAARGLAVTGERTARARPPRHRPTANRANHRAARRGAAPGRSVCAAWPPPVRKRTGSTARRATARSAGQPCALRARATVAGLVRPSAAAWGVGTGPPARHGVRAGRGVWRAFAGQRCGAPADDACCARTAKFGAPRGGCDARGRAGVDRHLATSDPRSPGVPRTAARRGSCLVDRRRAGGAIHGGRS